MCFSNKDDTMTEGAEGCSSDDPLASLPLDVASGGSSSASQQPESQAEVSTLCIPSADNDIDKIIAGEWHGGECKSMYAVCQVLIAHRYRAKYWRAKNKIFKDSYSSL